MKQSFYILVLAVMLGLVLLPGSSAAEDSDGSTLKRAVFKIESGDRWTWFTAVKYELSTMKGVSGVGGNILRRLVAVDYHAPVTAREINRRISEAGFTATLHGVRTVTQKQSFSYIGSRQQQGSCSVPDTAGSCCPPSQSTGDVNDGVNKTGDSAGCACSSP